jgi:hypothetical protein
VGACIGVSVHSDIFVTGETNSTNLPMLNPGLGAYYDNTSNGGQDGFIAKFNNDIIPVVLPVDLVSFNCETSPVGIHIHWITAHETNNHYFTVERTRDGENYEKVAVINGSLNSYSTRHYSYTDKEAGSGSNYYRLTQTDYNGKNKTFEVIACSGPDETGEVLMKIYTVTGQLIHTSRTKDYQRSVKTAGIPSGLYLVELTADGNTKSFKHLAAQ